MTYFVIENNCQQGPFTLEELRLHHLTSETLVWAEGMAEWTPAWKVAELRPIINGTPPKIPASTLQSAQSDTHSDLPETEEQPARRPSPHDDQGDMAEKRGGNRSSRLIGIIALLVILLLMVFTNPTKEAHETAIRREVTTAMDNLSANDEEDIFSQGLNMLSRMINHRILDAAIGQMLTYHNYGLFSTCTIDFDGHTHRASFGWLGHVWTVNSKDIERKVNGSTMRGDDPGAMDENNDAVRRHNGQGLEPDAGLQGDQGSSADDADSDIEKYVMQQTDKTIQMVSEKVKTSIRNEVNQHTDSTSAKTVNKLVDKILSLLGI